MRKKGLCLMMTVCLLLSLTGCVGGKRNEEKTPAAPLPAARVMYAAPDGDGPVGTDQVCRVYVWERSELQLLQEDTLLRADDLYHRARVLAETQLAAENACLARQAGNRTQLSLYSEEPIEISAGICTVNLGPTALQLSYSELYKACIALATTLCELEEISFVNVLVADQSIGLDITGSLAMGTLTAHPDENLPVLWEQMEARRTPLGEDLSRTPLSALATLYHPLAEGQGISCETRMMLFEGQTPQQIAAGLLGAVAEQGPGAEKMAEMMLHEPLTSEMEDGGRLITLSFREGTEERLAETGTDMACLMAGITCTLTTFIPGIAAVCIRIGDKPITELRSPELGTVTVLGGVLKRSAMAPFLRGSAAVFFGEQGKLARTEEAVNRQDVDSPRAQLNMLIAGPGVRNRAAGMEGTIFWASARRRIPCW